MADTGGQVKATFEIECEAEYGSCADSGSVTSWMTVIESFRLISFLMNQRRRWKSMDVKLPGVFFLPALTASWVGYTVNRSDEVKQVV